MHCSPPCSPFREQVVTDSPYAERAGERKESIKNLMKELSRDVKSMASGKDKNRDKDGKDMPAPAAAGDLESVKSAANGTGESMFQRTRSLRLFRTVSLLSQRLQMSHIIDI